MHWDSGCDNEHEQEDTYMLWKHTLIWKSTQVWIACSTTAAYINMCMIFTHKFRGSPLLWIKIIEKLCLAKINEIMKNHILLFIHK